ncbi:MAG: S-layer homology domain-containing protein, partial [Clostridia bacterium]
LDAYDPDNDTIQYFIEKYPSNGNAKIINNSLTYMPLAQYTGKDTVSVYAVDKFGNKSALVEVKINVEKNNLGFTFSDMKDNDAHLAAIELAEKSVIAYRYVSGEYLFGPEDKVSKIDFMIMLLSAANVDTAIKSDIQLKFKDLAKLPVEKQKYIKKAVEMGIIINNSTDFGFDKPVMKSEAAEWISKLLNLKITDNIDFIDIDKNQTDLKIYAAATIEFGIFSANGNKFEPKTVLKRD